MNPSDTPKDELVAEVMEARGKLAESEASSIALEKRLDGRLDSEARSKAMLEAFDGLICVCSSDYEVEFMNERLIERTGRSPMGEKCYQALHGLEEVCSWCVNEKVQRGETVRWEVQSPRDNRWYYVVNSPVRNRDGSISNLAVMQDITERKRIEGDLRNSERLFKSIVSASPVAIGISQRRQITWVNDVWLRMFGFDDANECKGQDTRVLYPSQEEYERVGKILYEDLETGKVTETDARFRRKDGTLFDALIRMKALNPADPDNGVISAISDISDRKRAEEANEKYRLVVEHAQESIIVAQDGMLRFVNPTTVEILGYSEEELLSKPFTEFIHPDDREMVLQRHVRRLRGEQFPTFYSFRTLHKDGSTKWIEIDSAMIEWDGRPASLAFMIDITERLRMEEALREKEEWYRTLVEESFDGMFIQRGPKILFANSRLHEMLGYGERGLEGLDHWMIYHPDYQALTRERGMARMRGEDVVSQYEVKLQRKDGSCFDGEISARGVTVKGEPGVLVWVKDVSKRKRAEEAQRRLATVVEQAAEAVVVTDTTGNIHYVNPAFERVSGYSRNEVIGQNPRLLKSGKHDEAFYKNLWDTITRGENWKGIFINKKKDGTLYHTETTISPVRDSGGKIVNFVAVKRDITKQLELSQQLLQARKMEAVGTLAGGIAHDFNNLLQVTQGFSELLLAQKEAGDPEHADLLKIFHAAKNGAELVQRLLTFSRKVEIKPVPLNLNNQVIQVEKLLARTIPKMIEIRQDLTGDLARIHADPSQVEQVLVNLAINARDAMPEGGRLTIGTANVRLDSEWCKAHIGSKPGAYVLLTVSDTGQGMDSAILSHVFEPFYTTKPLGRGTGLGLATVYGIVQQHGGYITCESELGRGTTFKVYFPAIETTAPPDVEEPGELPAHGSETLLLVDDEEFVGELGARILTKAGYTVLTAGDGQEALDLFKKERSRISLVILDLIMPKMGGKDCLKGLLTIDPKLKVLVASGLSENSSPRQSIEMGAKGFVSKPFRIKEFLGQVRKILDES